MKAVWLIMGVASMLPLVRGAHATEYKSVAVAAAALYDAPSEKGRKTYVVPRDMPLEVVLTYGAWSKVRDAGGDLAWIKSDVLSAKRHLVTIVPAAKVHALPHDQAPVLFTADEGVLLELLAPASSDWLKVRHQDGEQGYIRASSVWGDPI